MDYINLINTSLLYIEEHIKDMVTPDEVADHVMYSAHHFSRMFSDQVGLSIKQYTVNRRIKHVLYKASKGSLLIDVIFDYGFDSYSGFYKACHKTYGLSPKLCLENLKIDVPVVFLLGKEKYPMITEAKLKKHLKNWNIDQMIQPVYSENRQKRKDMWSVDNHNIMMTQNYNKVLESIRIETEMNKAGILTPQFVKNKDGEYYQKIDDNYLIVKEKFDYHTYDAKAISENKEVRINLGSAVGKLHLLMTDLDDKTANISNAYDTVKNWAKDIVLSIDKDGLGQTFFDEFEAFDTLSKKIPTSIIHRNMHLNNIFYSNDELIGYGDFYLTQKDVRIFDICYLATSILDAMDNHVEWFSILKDLFQGYNSVVKLTEAEYESIPYVIYAVQMIFIAYFKTQDNYEDLALKNYDTLLWLYQNKSSLNLA